jgi:potassium/chloride transporter 4/5/6
VETLTQCNTTSKAVLVCMNLHAFPKRAERVEGYIDVWWVVHDGGLLMLLAHLLQQHRVWHKCRLRVHTVSEEWDNPGVVKANLEKLLEQVGGVNGDASAFEDWEHSMEIWAVQTGTLFGFWFPKVLEV